MSLRPLRPLATLARSVRAAAVPRPALAPAVGCSYWRVPARAFASPPSQESADFFAEVEVDEGVDEALNLGDEVEEGVFVSVVAPPETAAARKAAPRSIKHLNRLLGRHEVPDLLESELEEKFVRGRGPGGQAINKTNSSVCLTHLPTGLRVQAQPTRSREENRAVARKILKERLDLMRRRGELDGVDTASAGGGAGEGQGALPPDASRKEKLAAEARTSSKAELRWEKERRRKLNRAKKVKRREGRGKEAADGEGEEGS